LRQLLDAATELTHPARRTSSEPGGRLARHAVLHRSTLAYQIPAFMSRTQRFLRGMQLTFVNQTLAILVGLWLTRYALQMIGREQYGLWLFAMQLLAYMALLDLGVAALLPREAAFAAGADSAAADPVRLAHLVRETTQLARWQTPVVASAALLVWFLTPPDWAALRPSLAFALAAYTAVFPFRVYQALLVGLQDLAFTSAVQGVSWAVGVATTVALLATGHGILSLAAGWAVTQLITPLACWRRARTRFPRAFPAGGERLKWPAAQRYMARSLWLSVGQIANNLEAGADVLIIGTLLGPAAVVPYVCTGKLITIFGNLPLALAHNAGPALSDLRVRESRKRLLTVAGGLMQAVLIATGCLACVTLVVTEGFVGWWVGASLFGGPSLLVWLVLATLLRHWGTTLVYTVYSFGHERRLATIAVVHGAISIALMVPLVRTLGPVGAPIAVVAASAVATFPLALTTLMADIGSALGGLLHPLVPWAARFVPAAVGAYILAPATRSAAPLQLASAAIATFALYSLLMMPVALRPPLRDYVVNALASTAPRLARLVARGNRP
jgi:O-antigen/teichoic acid export membrane protein